MHVFTKAACFTKRQIAALLHGTACFPKSCRCTSMASAGREQLPRHENDYRGSKGEQLLRDENNYRGSNEYGCRSRLRLYRLPLAATIIITPRSSTLAGQRVQLPLKVCFCRSPQGPCSCLAAGSNVARRSCPLRLTGPYGLEGTMLSKRLAASRHNQRSCPGAVRTAVSKHERTNCKTSRAFEHIIPEKPANAMLAGGSAMLAQTGWLRLSCTDLLSSAHGVDSAGRVRASVANPIYYIIYIYIYIFIYIWREREMYVCACVTMNMHLSL